MGCIYGHVYIPLNKIIYVGQYKHNFCSIDSRTGGKTYSHYKGQQVYDFIQKVGYENIKTICLEDKVPIENLNDLEHYYIIKYNTYPVSEYSFNCNTGGSGHIEEAYEQWEIDIINNNYSFLKAIGCAKLINNDSRCKHKRTARSIAYVARCRGLVVDYTLFCAETNSYYESPTIFANTFNIKSTGIVSCAALGTRETIVGMHLAYKADKDRMEYIKQFINKLPNDSFYKTRHWQVYCAEDDINYTSLSEMQKLGVGTRALVVAMNKGKTYFNGKHYAFVIDIKAMQSIQQYKNKAPQIIIESRRKPLYCLELDKSFTCGIEAEAQLNIARANIIKAVKNWNICIGGYHWCYLKDKDKLINMFPNLQGCNKKQESIKIKVMCIETGQVFMSVKEAGLFYNIQPGHITGCCNGRAHCNTAGKLLDGTKLHWKYLNKGE